MVIVGLSGDEHKTILQQSRVEAPIGSGSDGTVIRCGPYAVKSFSPDRSGYVSSFGTYRPETLELSSTREARIHEALMDAGVPVPRLYGLGAEFSDESEGTDTALIMDHIPGTDLAKPPLHKAVYEIEEGDTTSYNLVSVFDISVSPRRIASFIDDIEDGVQKALNAGIVPGYDFLSNIRITSHNKPVFLDFLRWRKKNEPRVFVEECLNYEHELDEDADDPFVDWDDAQFPLRTLRDIRRGARRIEIPHTYMRRYF